MLITNFVYTALYPVSKELSQIFTVSPFNYDLFPHKYSSFTPLQMCPCL